MKYIHAGIVAHVATVGVKNTTNYLMILYFSTRLVASYFHGQKS